MIEYLLNFSKYAQLSDFAVLLVYLLVVDRKTAFGVILLFSCVLGSLHIFWEVYMFNLLEDDSNGEIVRTLWYLGFSVSDFLFVILSVWLCNLLNLERDKVCNFILVTYLVLGFIQASRYLDRIIFGTDYLGLIYNNGIPALNLAISTAAIFYLLNVIGRAVSQFYGDRL